MDEQGVEAAWLFPSQGVCMEGPMQPDIEASIHILRAFNRWLEEDWGFATEGRIFGVPFLTLSDLDQAVDELGWCLDTAPGSCRSATARRSHPRAPSRRPTRCSTLSGPGRRSRLVAPHAGFEDGYTRVDQAVAEEWGRQPAKARRRHW